KRRSPSRGILREDLNPAQVAQAYEVGGAAALSVLTEEQFFGGSVDDLKEARQATLLPALRKDFTLDPYQVWESLRSGAAAVLLTVAAVNDSTLGSLAEAAREARLDALFEVHDADDLQRALRLEPRIVGVNNRDLRTLSVDLQTSLDLIDKIPDDVVAVAESGLRGAGEVRRLRDAGFDAFLVGEHLMLADDPGAALEQLVLGSAAGDRARLGPRGGQDLRHHVRRGRQGRGGRRRRRRGLRVLPQEPARDRPDQGARDRRVAAAVRPARRRVRGRARRAHARD